MLSAVITPPHTAKNLFNRIERPLSAALTMAISLRIYSIELKGPTFIAYTLMLWRIYSIELKDILLWLRPFVCTRSEGSRIYSIELKVRVPSAVADQPHLENLFNRIESYEPALFHAPVVLVNLFNRIERTAHQYRNSSHQ